MFENTPLRADIRHQISRKICPHVLIPRIKKKNIVFSVFKKKEPNKKQTLLGPALEKNELSLNHLKQAINSSHH